VGLADAGMQAPHAGAEAPAQLRISGAGMTGNGARDGVRQGARQRVR